MVDTTEKDLNELNENGDPVVGRAINVSIVVNVVLTVAKTYACLASGSLAVLASLLDSVLDLASQVSFLVI
jgi:divalent metal cation (Fe/Co/Zn/Cd) transporter